MLHNKLIIYKYYFVVFFFITLLYTMFVRKEKRGGEGFLRLSLRRRHLPKIRTFKKFGNFSFGQTDRQTDSQTLWFIWKLHF